MKRSIAKILIAVMLASVLLTALTTVALAEFKVYITGDSVYVRKGPGTYYSDLGTVHYGESYTATAMDDDDRGVTWYRIKYKGGSGWVSSKYASTTPGGKTYGRIYATGGSTYVRAEPNRYSTILEDMPQGSSADYLDRKERDERGVIWYNVSYKGRVGWVSSKYTSTTPGGGEESGTVVATGGSTYIREEPDVDADIITSMAQYASADYRGKTVYDDRGVAWYKVRTNSGKTGWVSSKFTTLY